MVAREPMGFALKNSHLEPLAQDHWLLLIREFTQTLEEDLGASVDILLTLEHVGQGVDMVEDSPALAMLFVVDLCEGVGVLAEAVGVPDGVEVRLVERVLVAVNDLDGFRVRAGDLVRGNSQEGAVLGMEAPLRLLHCSHPARLAKSDNAARVGRDKAKGR